MLLLISIKLKVSNVEIDMNEIVWLNDVFIRMFVKCGNLVEDFIVFMLNWDSRMKLVG